MLTPQQQAILQELQSRDLNPHQKAIVGELMSRKGFDVKQLEQEDKPLEQRPLLFEAGGPKPLEAISQLGDMAGELGNQTGHPIYGAMAKYGIKAAPYALAAKAGLEALPTVAEDATLLAKSAGQGLQNAGSAVGKGIDSLVEGSATKGVRALRNVLTDLPAGKLAKEAALDEAKKTASNAIEVAREAAGHPQQLYDMSHVRATDFANIMKNYEPKATRLESLLKFRDRAASVIDNGATPQEAAIIRRGMQKIDTQIATMGKNGKAIANAYNQYGEVMDAADSLNLGQAAKKAATEKGIRELAGKSARERIIRKAAKIGLGAAAGTGLGHWIFH